MGDVDLVEILGDSLGEWRSQSGSSRAEPSNSIESLLSELCALRLEGQRLRLELESWPPAYAAPETLPPTFDDEDSERPTWIPDGEDRGERRDTLRC